MAISFAHQAGSNVAKLAPFVLLIALIVGTVLPAAAQPRTLAAPTAEPTQVRIGSATKVRFAANISDPTLIAGSVNLLRVGAAGTTPATIGVLRDDGTSGDEIAGDGRYSLEVTLNEPAATRIAFRVSAAFRGSVMRTVTPDLVVEVMANRPPVAVPGANQAALTGTSVLLDGRQSYDLDGDELIFYWTLVVPAGSGAALDNPSLVKPTFTVDVVGSYIARLVVNDGTVDSVARELTIQGGASGSMLPTAAIGALLAVPFGVGPTATVPLTGAGSFDPNGNALTFAWLLVGKPAASTNAALTAVTGATPSLIADKPGRYTVQLKVSGGGLESAPAQATIILYKPNMPPTVDAGADRNVPTSSHVALVGSVSDTDGDTLVDQRWALLAVPFGSTAVLTGETTLTPSFTADATGDYLLELTATDARGAIGKARILVRANGPADSDHDGVADTTDACPGTPPNTPVDARGCAASQLPPVTISALTADPASGKAPLTLSFTSQAAGGTGSYIYGWDFGDTQISPLQNPEHTYLLPDIYSATVSATDTLGSTSQASVTITVTVPPANHDPQITSSPATAGHVGLAYRYQVLASDVDGDSLSYMLPISPTGMTISATGLINWTPSASGTFPVEVSATDGHGGSALQSYNMAVAPSMVSVPNVVGLTQVAATTALTAADLTLGSVTQQTSVVVAAGNVISEDPVAGTLVAQGSPVNLAVSTGVGGQRNPSSFEKIDKAELTGAIDRETAILYKVFATFKDPRLPAAFKGDDSGVFESNALELVYENLAIFSDASIGLLVPFFVPPAWEGSWASQPSAAQTLSLLEVGTSSAGLTPREKFDAAKRAICQDAKVSPDWFPVKSTKYPIAVWFNRSVIGARDKALLARDALDNDIGPTLIGTVGMRMPPGAKEGYCSLGDLEVYLTDVASLGETLPADASSAKATPAFILLNQALDGHPLKGTLAHEVFHASQFAYDVKGSGVASDYLWLMESTAQWFIDAVYPQLPNDPSEYGGCEKPQFEQCKAHFYMDEPYVSPEQRSADGAVATVNRYYGAYLFFQFLASPYSNSRRIADPAIVGRIWEKTSGENGEANQFDAVDKSIPDGLKVQWPDFARFLWNGDQSSNFLLPGFASLDGLLERPSAYEWSTTLDGQASKTSHVFDGKKNHLSIEYHHFKFTDPNVRFVTFHDRPPDPRISTQVFSKVQGRWKREPGDAFFTPEFRTFCRDKKSERLEELYIVISNSSVDTDVDDPDEANRPWISFSSVGCFSYAGTTTYTTEQNTIGTSGNPSYSGSTIGSAGVEFKLPGQHQHGLSFASSGRAGAQELYTYHYPPTFQFPNGRICTISGVVSGLVNVQDGSLWIDLWDDNRVFYSTPLVSSGDGASYLPGLITDGCSSTTDEYLHFDWFYIPSQVSTGQQFVVDEKGNIEGSYSSTVSFQDRFGSHTTTTTSTWQLAPVAQ